VEVAVPRVWIVPASMVLMVCGPFSSCWSASRVMSSVPRPSARLRADRGEMDLNMLMEKISIELEPIDLTLKGAHGPGFGQCMFGEVEDQSRRGLVGSHT
jgi:hypothetical protein